MKKTGLILLASCSFTLAMSLDVPKDRNLPMRVRAMVAWVQQNKMRLGAAAAGAAGLYWLRRSYTGWRHDRATAWDQLKKEQRAGYRDRKRDAVLMSAARTVMSPSATSFDCARAAQLLVANVIPGLFDSYEQQNAMHALLAAPCGREGDAGVVPSGSKIRALEIIGRETEAKRLASEGRVAVSEGDARRYRGGAGALVSTSSDPGSAGYASLAERKRHSPHVD